MDQMCDIERMIFGAISGKISQDEYQRQMEEFSDNHIRTNLERDNPGKKFGKTTKDLKLDIRIREDGNLVNYSSTIPNYESWHEVE